MSLAAAPGGPADLRERVVERFGEGLSLLAIAAQVGITERRVKAIIVDAGGEALWTPRCMDADELETWRTRASGWAGSEDHRARPAMDGRTRRAVWTDTNGRAMRPCSDCLLGYAAEMRLAGRCNGTPGGERGHDSDPLQHLEEETTMDQPVAARAVERLRVDEATQTRVEVAVSAPCGTCAHAPVCGLRETLVALTDVVVRLPRLDEAIAIRIDATATCGHYSRAKRGFSPAGLEALQANAELQRAKKAAKDAKAAEAVA